MCNLLTAPFRYFCVVLVVLNINFSEVRINILTEWKKIDRQLDYSQRRCQKFIASSGFHYIDNKESKKYFGSVNALYEEVGSFATILRRYFISRSLLLIRVWGSFFWVLFYSLSERYVKSDKTIYYSLQVNHKGTC